MVFQVFEDEKEAVKYCDLLQGGGKGCEGVAEIDASSVKYRMLSESMLTNSLTLFYKLLRYLMQVFDLCHKMRALAVLFRRGRTPPLPQSLELNLKARKRSLEDQEDLI